MAAQFVATAPGKLVLAGEYAVLDGGVAISAAVNKFARATISVADASILVIANTGARFPYDVKVDGLPAWQVDPGEFGSVLAAACHATANYIGGMYAESAWQVELCTRDFYQSGPGTTQQKLGIGSSAAITVALVAAMQSCAGLTPEFVSSMVAHRWLQRGVGSGIDIATSWYGGVVLMEPSTGGTIRVEQLNWPNGLHVRALWSGEAASTPAMLARLAAYKQTSADGYKIVLEQMRASLTAIRNDWQRGEIDALINGLVHYGELLGELDAAAGIGIWSQRHREIQALAKSYGIGYKPSGAGGGDFGLAFSQDKPALERFVAEVDTKLVSQEHGVTWSDQGLRVNGCPIAVTNAPN